MKCAPAALTLPLVLGLVCVAAPPEGPAACAGCHRAQAIEQPHTSMGRALETVRECEILRAHPLLTFRQGGFSFQIARAGDSSVYTVTDGKETFTVPIAWAFGLGAAGQTYVYQWKGDWYESRVSFYRKTGALDLTMGAQNSTPPSLEEAAGRRMSPKDAADCFGCHATNAVRAGRVQLDGLAPGVQCERCHGSAARHLSAISAGDVKAAAMQQLGTLSTEDLSDFCGQCHRTWSQIAMTGPHDINNVRFQPYRLTNSRCYDAADRRIRCVACHDPHREVERDAATYDARCLACHMGPGKQAPGQTAKRCPAAARNCASCHMPKYDLPGSHNLFTDHQIRVVKPGEPYPG